MAKTKERLAAQGYGPEILTILHQNFANIDQVAAKYGPFDFQFIACNRAQTLGRGNSCLRIQAKIQRSIIFVGKERKLTLRLHCVI